MYSFDISLPLSRFYEIVELTREKLKDIEDVKAVCGFGHIGELKKLIIFGTNVKLLLIIRFVIIVIMTKVHVSY